MKLEHAEVILDFLQSQGTEASVYEGYSGRGMFRAETAGVVTRSATDVEDAMDVLGINDSQRHDSLGLSVVVY